MRHQNVKSLFDAYLPEEGRFQVFDVEHTTPSADELLAARFGLPKLQRYPAEPIFLKLRLPKPWFLLGAVGISFIVLAFTLIRRATFTDVEQPTIPWVLALFGVHLPFQQVIHNPDLHPMDFTCFGYSLLPFVFVLAIWIFKAYRVLVENAKLREQLPELQRRYRRELLFVVNHNKEVKVALQSVKNQHQENIHALVKAELQAQARKWTPTERDLRGLFIRGDLKPKTRGQIRVARRGGYVTSFEDSLAKAFKKYLPVIPQVWTPAGYPADFVVLVPTTGHAWIIELDGANSGEEEKDHSRNQKLTACGFGVIRVQNSVVKVKCEDVATAMFEYLIEDG